MRDMNLCTKSRNVLLLSFYDVILLLHLPVSFLVVVKGQEDYTANRLTLP